MAYSLSIRVEKHGLKVMALVLVDTKTNHINALLKDRLLGTLREFNITVRQMFACAVDNVSNIIRTLQLLIEEENDDSKQGKDECEEAKNNGDFITVKHSIYHVRCAEHSKQLGIRDVLKRKQPEKFFTKQQKIAQHLCSPNTDRILKRRAGEGM